MTAPLAIVAAIAANGVIGDGQRMPWRLSSDLRRFRAVTTGKPLLMGRKTFQSIGRVLPGRETIVVTHDKAFAGQLSKEAGVHLAHDLDEALNLAQARARAMGADEIILAGGGVLYAALIDRAERMYLTFVDAAPAGDVRFPAVDWSLWRETRRSMPPPSDRDDAAFAFADYLRR